MNIEFLNDSGRVATAFVEVYILGTDLEDKHAKFAERLALTSSEARVLAYSIAYEGSVVISGRV